MPETYRSNFHTVRLRLHETNRPVPGLVVTWYVTADNVVRDELRDPLRWDAQRRDDITAFGLRRIGSSITDDSGTARLSLPDELQSAPADRRASNVWYSVRTPDIASDQSCGRTVHVACDLIPLGAGHEELLVRIPMSSLEPAAPTRRAPFIIDSNIRSADLADALRTVEGAPSPRPAPVQDSVGRSVNGEISTRVDGATLARGRLERRRSAATGLEVRARGRQDRPQLSFDRGTNRLLVQDPGSQVDVPLVFDGVERYLNAGLTEERIDRPHAEVDEATGTVKLVLPKVPDVLAARDEPSLLRRFLQP